MIPEFREDGYLPDGVHIATAAQIRRRFGISTGRRRRLWTRLRRWIELAQLTHARRLLVGGSFVTSTSNPRDVDAVVLLAEDFDQQFDAGMPAAVELDAMIVTRRPKEIYAAENDSDWRFWVEYFGSSREEDGRHKGIVEVEL